jgi:hypothetical protein
MFNENEIFTCVSMRVSLNIHRKDIFWTNLYTTLENMFRIQCIVFSNLMDIMSTISYSITDHGLQNTIVVNENKTQSF